MDSKTARRFACLAFVLLPASPGALAQSPPAAGTHAGACDRYEGMRRARCQRHDLMFAQCGPLKGDAHFACDRTFLLAHPLDCSGFTGRDAAKCAAEGAAFKSCEAKPGRDFVACVIDATDESPMGH